MHLCSWQINDDDDEYINTTHTHSLWHKYTRNYTSAEGPRDALSVEILSTAAQI